MQARGLIFFFPSGMTSTFYPALADLDNFRKNSLLEVFSPICADAQADRLYSDGTCPQSHFGLSLTTPNFGRCEQWKMFLTYNGITLGTSKTPLFFIRRLLKITYIIRKYFNPKSVSFFIFITAPVWLRLLKKTYTNIMPENAQFHSLLEIPGMTLAV